MLRFLGEHYAGLVGGAWFGEAFSIFVGVVFGLLLISAVNTAIVALIGVIYMMAQDGEMPQQFARLNKHGVPRIPLIVAVAIPILVLAIMRQFESSCGSVCHRRCWRYLSQSRCMHIQQAFGTAGLRTPDHGCHIPRACFGRSDHRQNKT